MKYKFPLLNGWIRLYIVAVVLWAGFLSYWIYVALPNRASDYSLELRATSLLSEEINRIQGIRDRIERYQAADGYCERWYLKASEQRFSVNKNQCLEFMITSDKNELVANANTIMLLRAPLQKNLVRELREAQDSLFWSDVRDFLPHFAAQLIGGAVALLAIGFLVAWVRRGFKAGTPT